MSAEQYLAMTFVQLKQECAKRGLDTNGSKDHLVKRLLTAGGGAPSSPSPASPSHAASPQTSSPSTHSPGVAGAAAKFGGVHHASPSAHTEPTSPQLKHSVSWKVQDEEKKASPAPATSPQSKFLQDAEKRKRELEAEQERQRQEDALSRFAAEREEKRKQEEAERQRRQAAEDDARRKQQQDAQDAERRRQEEERRKQQQDEDNRHRQQEEADRRRANEEQERRRQNEEADRRRQQEEADRRRQQEEQERRRQNEEAERRRQQEEADRKRQREEEQRHAEMRARQEADLKKAGDERVRAAMAESQRLEVETAKAHDEAKRKAEQAKTVQDEARRKEEEARRLTEESRRLTEEAKHLYDAYRKLEEQSKAARRAVTEAQKKSEDDARKTAEANIVAARKAQAEENARRAQQERDAEARRAQQEREAEAARKKTEDEKRQREQQQQEEERRRAAAEEEERRRKMASPEPEKKRTIEIFESDSDEEDSSGKKSNGKSNTPQDPALAALIAERNRARQGVRGGRSSPASSSPQHVNSNSNPSTPSPEEQRRKLMASKPLPAAPKSAPVTPQQDRRAEEKESPPKLEVAVMNMGPDSDNEASDSSTPRGTTPRGLKPFAKVAWFLRDWEWSSKDEIGQSEDEPPAVLSIKRDYQGDMFWLICESTDDARKLTRHVPESQKMLEASSGFYDPYLDRASSNYSSMLMIQQGKKVFFLCSRDLTICVRKSCQYVENSLHEARYRGHGMALKNKMIDRLEELKEYYPGEDQDAMADAVDFEDRNSVAGASQTPMQRGHSRNKSLGDKLTLTPEDKEAIKGMKDTAAKAMNQGMEKTKTGIKNIVASLK